MAICFCTMAQSQFTTLVPELYKISAFRMKSGSFTVEGANSNYVYFTSLQDNSIKNYNTDGVFTMDKEGSSCEKTLVNLPDNYNFLKGFEANGELMAFYTSYDKKTKQFGLCVNRMNLDGGTASWAPEEFLSYQCEKRDGTYLETAISPDRRFFSILLLATDKKNSFKGTFLFVFDNQGSMLWQQEVPVELNERTFGVLDMAITNNGTVYVAVDAYFAPNNKTRTDEIVNIYEITDNNVNVTSQRVDFGFISNGKILLAKNGDVVLGGYYRTDLKENETGSYICRYNPTTSGFESMDNKEFEGYSKKGGKGGVTNNVSDDNYWVTVEALFEYENGSIVLLGEQQYSAVYTVNNNGTQATTWKYWAKNIMYTAASQDGTITGFDMFMKNQVASSGMPQTHKYLGISYYAYMQDDQIRIVFADNYNNYHGKSDQMLIKTPKSQEAIVMLTIDSDGKDGLKVLFDTKTAKMWMTRPLFSSSDSFIAITRSGKYEAINKISIP